MPRYSAASGLVRQRISGRGSEDSSIGEVGGGGVAGSPSVAKRDTLIHQLERDGGVWFAKGGTNRLVAGMVRHFKRLGGTLRVNEPVEQIVTEGDRARRLRTPD